MSALSTFRRRVAENRCTRCGGKKPPTCTTRDCPDCLRKLRGERGSSESLEEKRARFDAQVARVVETAYTMTSHEQAADLGITTDRIRYVRHHARAKGYDVPKELGGHKGTQRATNHESPKWRELEAHQAHCERCGLRGPHECIPSILELASSRRGPGRVMPEGGPSGMRVGEKRR